MKTISECVPISCCGADAGNFGVYIYSLVSGASYSNEESTFVIDCPPGYNCLGPTITITLPPGTVIFTPVDVDPNPPRPGDPWTPAAGTYTFNCGTQRLVITLAAGQNFTAAQITQITTFLASCTATRQAYQGLQPVSNKISFTNEAVYYDPDCEEQSKGMVFTGTLPNWILIEVSAGNNRFAGRPGTFSGANQLAANQAAQTAINNFAAAEILAGRLTCVCFTTDGTLPDATVGEPYSTTLVPAAGLPGTFAVTLGALPDGLSLNLFTGVISGTPTESASFGFEVTYTPN